MTHKGFNVKKKIIIAVVLLQFLPLFSNDNMKIVVDNVSIEVPVGWLSQYTKSPQLFFLYSPVEVNDTFQENCNLTIEYLPSSYTIQEYKKAGVTALKSVYGDFQLVESSENYHIITGLVGEVSVKQIQYFYIKSNIAYVLTFSSNPENFSRYKEQFESIAETFIY
jgi:hypothetical protein